MKLDFLKRSSNYRHEARPAASHGGAPAMSGDEGAHQGPRSASEDDDMPHLHMAAAPIDLRAPASDQQPSRVQQLRPSSGLRAAARAADPGTASAQAELDHEVSRGDDPNARTQLKPLDIEVPEIIGRYRLGERIGSGTCGVVHLALDAVLNREVAIKLSPVGSDKLSNGKVPGAQRAYETELVAAGRLHHPNIVTVHDAGRFDDLNFLVMESVVGHSLKEFGKGRTTLPVHRALEVIRECCKGLAYSHSQDILHRDIKPANIIIADDGSVKLLDFGIAVGLSENSLLARHGPTLGTPNYMSPEQILGRELSPASDLYSLSTVLFELLTGRQLFKAKKVKDLFRTVVNQPAPRVESVRPELPRELGDIVAKGLEKKPSMRYQSGEDMAAALTPLIERFRIIESRTPAQQRFIRELQQTEFFQGFADVEIARLLELVRVRRFERGDRLLSRGDTHRSLYIVTDGVARISEQGDLLGLVSSGDCVGELGFINGAPEHKDIIALTAVTALEVHADALSDLPPKVHLHYYRAISDLLVSRMASEGRLQLDCTL